MEREAPETGGSGTNTHGTPRVDVVVPTIGRPSLAALLTALDTIEDLPAGEVLVVDDRREAPPPLALPELNGSLAGRVRVLRSGGRGPAAARNVGWRASDAEWIAFLDDDVLPGPAWASSLARDLSSAPKAAGGVQARLEVPLPTGRRPTDWERNVARLATAWWATADMAYRRRALADVGGFDERFRRAYREDSDLALRVERAGYRLVRGERLTHHPVRPAGPLVSVGMQRGNADDALMRALHGEWDDGSRRRGRRPVHLAVVSAAAGAAVARSLGARAASRVLAVAWLAGTLEFAWRRIAPGPRDPREVGVMLLTSVLIPPAATYWWIAGLLRARRLVPPSERVGASRRPDPAPHADPSVPPVSQEALR